MAIAATTTGVLHWGQKQQVGETDRSSWYDTTTYRVPVTGTVDTWKIKQSLRKHKFPPQHNVFGGYCSLGNVTDNNDGTVNVEVVYHIGN